MKIAFRFFPQNVHIPVHLQLIVDAFERVHHQFTSETYKLPSNQVLAYIRPELLKLGYNVENGKTKGDKIIVPVLFGVNNRVSKGFDADAVNTELKTVVEVEAGRAVTNYQFLKDLFEACVMVDTDYLVIAVRQLYRSRNDFESVGTFLETLFASDRITLPLKGILIVGY